MNVGDEDTERDVLKLRVRENTDIVRGENQAVNELHAGDKIAIMGGPIHHGRSVTGFEVKLTPADAVTKNEYQTHDRDSPYLYKEMYERDLAMLLADGRNLFKETKIKKEQDKKRQGKKVREAVLDAVDDDDVDIDGDG